MRRGALTKSGAGGHQESCTSANTAWAIVDRYPQGWLRPAVGHTQKDGVLRDEVYWHAFVFPLIERKYIRSDWRSKHPSKGSRTKQPSAVGMRLDVPFALAGLWDNWQPPGSDEWLRRIAIITTSARLIHDRMPVFIAPIDSDR
jgi:hypothetical protein